MSSPYNLITILGTTACGKTKLATALAYELNSEIISADSRQVYRGMDIGTGKDLEDYTINGKQIPYHLIDIVEAGTKYNVYEFQKDFTNVYNEITSRNITPILCGGSGLYLEAVIKGYNMPDVPANETLREELKNKSLEELTDILKKYKNVRNNSDTDTPKRAIRAIEIAKFIQENQLATTNSPQINSLIIGIDIDREYRRKLITKRLKDRLENGMIEEIKGLMDRGIPAEDLIYYGLEYKFVTLYLTNQLSYNEMFNQLEIAIHQFAKRQATWFRGMERRGFTIHWIPATMNTNDKIQQIKKLL